MVRADSVAGEASGVPVQKYPRVSVAPVVAPSKYGVSAPISAFAPVPSRVSPMTHAVPESVSPTTPTATAPAGATAVAEIRDHTPAGRAVVVPPPWDRNVPAE